MNKEFTLRAAKQVLQNWNIWNDNTDELKGKFSQDLVDVVIDNSGHSIWTDFPSYENFELLQKQMHAVRGYYNCRRATTVRPDFGDKVIVDDELVELLGRKPYGRIEALYLSYNGPGTSEGVINNLESGWPIANNRVGAITSMNGTGSFCYQFSDVEHLEFVDWQPSKVFIPSPWSNVLGMFAIRVEVPVWRVRKAGEE